MEFLGFLHPLGFRTHRRVGAVRELWVQAACLPLQASEQCSLWSRRVPSAHGAAKATEPRRASQGRVAPTHREAACGAWWVGGPLGVRSAGRRDHAGPMSTPTTGSKTSREQERR